MTVPSYTHPTSMRDHVAIVTGAARGVGKGIAAALLERGGSIVNLGSGTGTGGEANWAGYAGVKEWKQFAPDDYAKAVRRVPMKRIGDVRTDVGALVAFLLSTEATFITEQTIHVDGGIGIFR
jgi:NAD(P)-dependent dehydrogenase (short-subunit alcohol dehydrogenase family)